jgi:hypothetical protein
MEGCVYRPKHGYEDSGEMSQVDEDKTDELIFDATNRILKLEAALKRIRDCDWVITLPDRMDAVRQIAREALE